MSFQRPGIVALTTGVACGSVFLFIEYLYGISADNLLFIIVGSIAVAFFVFLLINYFVLASFRSKLINIYRSILDKKNVPCTSLHHAKNIDKVYDDVRNEIKNWESEKQTEIDELKKAENYRREFLGNVSHELKTPLFSAQGYVHTLIDGGIEDSDVNMLYLKKASKSLDRLIAMVEDLESISELETGVVPLEIITFDIVELIKEVNESLEIKANERKIRLIVESETERVYVYADKDKIRQVLVNLIENSIKYGREMGTTKVVVFTHSDSVMIEVADDGIGISSNNLPRLFERFYRVDKSRSREVGGTGLGLAIVKHIIEAHHQTIKVSSEKDKGTVFSFSLSVSKK